MHHHTLYNRISTRLLALAMAAVLVLCMLPAAAAAEYEGTCGKDLSWSFADGTLTITGSGDMTDYKSLESIPWYGIREQILWLELPDGLSRVGDLAFYGCSRLTTVAIPASVKAIGELAFCQCTGLSILKLESGLEVIGESAFEMCAAIQDLRLPETLIRLERQAFYGCASIMMVEIPAAVEYMGSGVFAHCVSLIRAKLKAPLAELPRWTFYGCESLASIELPVETKSIGRYGVYGCKNLTVVYYGGEPGDAQELMEQITKDYADFGIIGSVTDEDPGDSDSAYDVGTDENGDIIEENSTVTQSEESTISVVIRENLTDPDAESPPNDITATVVDQEGWDQLQDAVEEALRGGSTVNVDVFVTTDTDVPDSLLEGLAGRDVIMNVTTFNGSSYTLDFSVIDFDRKIDGLDLSYNLTALKEDIAVLEGAVGYRLRFNKTGVIRAQVKIQLPIEHARKAVTLYEIKKGKPTEIQSVVADMNGVASFYLASVDSRTEYLLGIDVPSVLQSQLLIPDTLENDYGITDQVSKVEYVVTGRVSKWGLTSTEVSKLMVGIMLSTAAFVGLLMYALNKRKLRKGYTPGWVEDDDEN